MKVDVPKLGRLVQLVFMLIMWEIEGWVGVMGVCCNFGDKS